MNETSSCSEYFLNDVVRIELFRSSDLQLSVPVTVPGVTGVSVTPNAAALLTIAYSQDGDTTIQEIDAAPTLKVTSALNVAGNLYTFDLQATIPGDIYKVREAERRLGTDDVAVVYTLADGRKKMSVPLPNTSKLNLDEQLGSSATHTLKVSVTSLNPLVEIV